MKGDQKDKCRGGSIPNILSYPGSAHSHAQLSNMQHCMQEPVVGLCQADERF